MNYPQLCKELIFDEGERFKLYECPAGKKTIGVGHNLTDNGISQNVSNLLLSEDVDTAVSVCMQLFNNWNTIDDERQRVLINMAFNLGLPGLSKFKNMIAAVNHSDWQTAAVEMLDSRWSSQVGNRAQRLAKRMRGPTI